MALYNGPANGDDWGYDIVVDSSGNIYVTGDSDGGSSGNDAVTIAYDPDGNELWAATYDGPDNLSDGTRAIAITSSGIICVTGITYTSGGGGGDILTIAYDIAGNELWAATYDGPANSGDSARAIASDSSGNIYVTGMCRVIPTDTDFATVAYDSSGNELWSATYDGPANSWEMAYDITTDAAGNVYVTGWSEGDGTQRDMATIAYDSSGSELWVVRYNGPHNDEDNVYAITTDSSDTIYVTGASYNSTTLYDYATIAYDSSGNELWVATYDGPDSNSDLASSIVTDSTGNIYVTGLSYSNATDNDYTTIAYDSSGNELWVAKYNGTENANDYGADIATDSSGFIYVAGESRGAGSEWDYATVAYDSSGNEVWTARYDGLVNLDDAALALVTDSDGNIYVTGNSWDDSINELGSIVTLKYAAKPNLAISSDDIIFTPPGPLAAGDNITCTATIFNHGTKDAENVEVAFYLHDPHNGGTLVLGVIPGNPQTIPLIPAGESVAVSIEREAPLIRTYDIYVWADWPETIDELDESNNIASNDILVGPDLTLDSSDIIFTPDPGTAGSPVTVTATIHNDGGQDVLDSFRVRFYHGDPLGNGIPIGQRVISIGIPAGGSEDVSITGVPPADGTYDIYVWTDHQNSIEEYNEINNISFSTAVINP